MKYIKFRWPEVQDYMSYENSEEIGYDPVMDAWFVPEYIIDKIDNKMTKL